MTLYKTHPASPNQRPDLQRILDLNPFKPDGRCSRSQLKRKRAFITKYSARRLIEAQYAENRTITSDGLKPFELEPEYPKAHFGTYNPPGFYRRGFLSGVMYPSHIGCTYV